MNKSGVDIWNADAIEVFFSTTNAAPMRSITSTVSMPTTRSLTGATWTSAGQTIPDYLEAARPELPTVTSARSPSNTEAHPQPELTAGNTIGSTP
jgi:hypothetical protein